MRFLKTVKKITAFFLLFCVAVLILGEIILRILGFGNMVLFCDNEYTGYGLQPNQDRVRFGKRIRTNEYSMRSDPLQEGEYRILMFGDSILNGGTYTDQAKLATTMLEKTLQEENEAVRVLNISCGGWGIDNCYGFLKQYGDLDAKAIVLVLSNHDAVGEIVQWPVAGTLYYPDRQYTFAWQELLERYILPRFGIYTIEPQDYTNVSPSYDLSKGWTDFLSWAREKEIPLVIYLHAQKNEVEEFGEYNYNGQRIIAFAEENGIPIYTDLERETVADFRDWIHLTEDGQQIIYDILLPALRELVER